mmetsp:Transcript_113919/g.316975  ORF Transcript_113919/g.316975 Transcript_113919/m.316975 type:complete len:243 (+) Transcript_113919:576-1304(+)
MREWVEPPEHRRGAGAARRGALGGRRRVLVRRLRRAAGGRGGKGATGDRAGRGGLVRIGGEKDLLVLDAERAGLLPSLPLCAAIALPCIGLALDVERHRSPRRRHLVGQTRRRHTATCPAYIFEVEVDLVARASTSAPGGAARPQRAAGVAGAPAPEARLAQVFVHALCSYSAHRGAGMGAAPKSDRARLACELRALAKPRGAPEGPSCAWSARGRICVCLRRRRAPTCKTVWRAACRSRSL